MQSPNDLPSVLGPYRLGGLLDEGGMAWIMAARRFGASGFEKQVALKILKPDLAADGRLLKLFLQEGHLGAAHQCQHLVSVLDMGVESGLAYIVMPRLRGVNLEHLRARTRLSESQSLFICQQVALGMHELHDMRDASGRPLGLVHRDISPGNVLVSSSGEVRLADLGIAKATLLSDHTWGRVNKGKFAYMSPEQARGESLSAASDRYSLGVVLLELLTGSSPLDLACGPTRQVGPLQVLERIRATTALPDLSCLPADLRPVLAECLAPDPTQRYAEDRSLMEDLLDALHRRPAASPLALGAKVSTLARKPNGASRPMNGTAVG